MTVLPKILPQPKRPLHLPEIAKWLSGEGTGSWFMVVQKSVTEFEINRYSPTGNFECGGTFTSAVELNITTPFTIDYPSHCAVVTLKINGEKIKCTAQ